MPPSPPPDDPPRPGALPPLLNSIHNAHKQIRADSDAAKQQQQQDARDLARSRFARRGEILKHYERFNRMVSAFGIEEQHNGYDKRALTMYAMLVGSLKNQQHPDLVKLMPALMSARVFAVPESAYLETRFWADRFTTEEVAKQEFLPMDAPTSGRRGKSRTLSDAEIQDYMQRVIEAAEQQRLPEHLPFEQTLLVYGGGAPLSDADHGIVLQSFAEDFAYISLAAHLVCADGNVWEFHFGYDVDQSGDTSSTPSGGFIFAQHHSHEEGWMRAHTLALTPWIVPAMLDLINSFKTVVEAQPNSLRFRKAWQEEQKRVKRRGGAYHHTPPPFYRVPLRHALVVERVRKRGDEMRAAYRRWKLQHRCDVRGHERVRFYRGKLPLGADVEKDLRERGYRIFMSQPLDGDTAKQLLDRGIRGKAPDEWMAVKATWVKPHMRGPEDAPYVPALRVVPQPGEGTP